MEVESSETVSIAKSLKDCLSKYAAIVDASDSESDSSLVLLQLNRLQIWAGNLGVFARGKASIDYRLQEDTDTRDIILGMIRRLSQKAQDFAKDIKRSERKPNKSPSQAVSSMPAESEDEFDESDGEIDSSSDTLDESVLSATEDQNSSSASVWVKDVTGLVDRLFLLASIIRKPLRYQNNSRILKSIEPDGPQAEDLEDLANHVRFQLKRAMFMPQTESHDVPSDALVDRLVEAAIFRRQRLTYKSRHQRKLQQGTNFAFRDAIPGLAMRLDRRGKAGMHSREDGHRQADHAEPSKSVVHSVSASTVLSGTMASSVFPLDAPKQFVKPAVSTVSRSAIVRHSKLDFPPIPKYKDKEDFVCPYCHVLQDSSLLQEVRWKRHVLQDLEPYVCVFEPCNSSSKLYSNIDDCMQHMKWNHGAVWACGAHGHESAVYDTPSGLEDHLRAVHQTSVAPSQIRLIVDKSMRPRDDTFSVCPICFEAVDEIQVGRNVRMSGKVLHDTTKSFRSHIAQHLEQIALLSLPPRLDIDDEEEESQAKQNEHLSLSTPTSSTTDLVALGELSSDISRGSFIGKEDEAVVDVPELPPGVALGGPGDKFLRFPLWRYREDDFDPSKDPVLKGFCLRWSLEDLEKVRKEYKTPPLPFPDKNPAEGAKDMGRQSASQEQSNEQDTKSAGEQPSTWDIHRQNDLKAVNLVPVYGLGDVPPDAPTDPNPPGELWPAPKSAKFSLIVEEFATSPLRAEWFATQNNVQSYPEAPRLQRTENTRRTSSFR